METSSLAKPKYTMDQNSLAAPNEYLSVVVGGRGSQNFEIKSPDPRLVYPGRSSDDISKTYSDGRGSKGSKVQHRILSDKLSSVHSEESEENYVAEYEIP